MFFYIISLTFTIVSYLLIWFMFKYIGEIVWLDDHIV